MSRLGVSEIYWNGPDGPAKLCSFCGCPMKPKHVKKKPDHYDHAQGCPYSRTAGVDPLEGK